jgi:hypothetical protein
MSPRWSASPNGQPSGSCRSGRRGFVERERRGRRNRYVINEKTEMRHPLKRIRNRRLLGALRRVDSRAGRRQAPRKDAQRVAGRDDSDLQFDLDGGRARRQPARP